MAADNPDEVGEVRRAIADQNVAYRAAVNGADAAALLALFTDDATVMLTGMTIKGRPALQEHAESMVRRLRNPTFKSLEVDVRNDLAYEVGQYTVENLEGAQTSGAYLVVWKKQPGGKWKIHVEATLLGGAQ
jgi:uncharacterized protein (TIGR02246 family)